MSDTSTHLGLPYLLAAQAQKHVTHNEALRLLDAMVQLSVLDRTRTTPPASPADGDRHLVASGATGLWAGWDLNVAFWVDGVCARQTMDKSVNDLFRLVSEYRPQNVGIEITGQQGAFLNWLSTEMMSRNIWFNFAMEKGRPGIRPETNKLSRFNLVVPLFKAGKMYFPTEMRTTPIIGEFMSEISLATINGLKGKDDCLDTISMLMNLTPWKPTEDSPLVQDEKGQWAMDDEDDDRNRNPLNSYIV